MAKARYGSTVRIPHEVYERVSKAAKECGSPVGSFVSDALEDVLRGLEAESAIRPRCIDKARAHQSDPVVQKKKPAVSQRPIKKYGKTALQNRAII